MSSGITPPVHTHTHPPTPGLRGRLLRPPASSPIAIFPPATDVIGLHPQPRLLHAQEPSAGGNWPTPLPSFEAKSWLYNCARVAKARVCHTNALIKDVHTGYLVLQ